MVGVVIVCMCVGCVFIGSLWSLRRMVRYLGSSLLAICWLHMCGTGL